jgi:hypothetical protein
LVPKSLNPDVYFAAQPRKNIGEAIAQRIAREAATPGLNENERVAVYAHAYGHYYGFDVGRGSSAHIQRSGDMGELVSFRINKARRILKAWLGLILGPRFSWKVTAASNNVNSRSAAVLGQNILEWLWKRRTLNRRFSDWLEQGLAFSEGFIFPEWDLTQGPVLGPEMDGEGKPTGVILKQGDLTLHNLLPWDVIRDRSRKSFRECDWLIARVWKSKWDLSALHRVDILGEPTEERIISAPRDEATRVLSGLPAWDDSSDFVPVYYFFHRPTMALPYGREVVMLNANTVLRDRELTYPGGIPLHRFAADEQFDTPFGYTSWWDCLATQELLDGLESAFASNLLTLGTGAVAVEDGTEVGAEHGLGNRFMVIPRGAHPPQGINLASVPAQGFAYLDSKSKDQQGQVGLNDVALGQPETAQMNAEAFALLASMSVQQNSPTQGAAIDGLGQLGFGILATLRKNVSDERTVAIVGKQNGHLARQQRFTGKDLEPVDAVVVETGNALEQTPAGRFQIAQLYMSIPGAVKTPEQVAQVLETGRLDPLTMSLRDSLMLVADENEQLLEGETPPAHIFEDHLLHFRENASVLNKLEARENPKVVRAVQAHCDEHYCLYWGLPLVDQTTGQRMQAVADPEFVNRVRLMLGQTPPAALMPAPVDPMTGAPMAGPGGAPPPPGAPPDALAPPGAQPAGGQGQPGAVPPEVGAVPGAVA